MCRFLTSVLNTLPKGLLVIAYAIKLRLSMRLWRPCGLMDADDTGNVGVSPAAIAKPH